MREYENVSIEEIRYEDYTASGGFFGSAFAKLAGALCVDPHRKLRPYCYGEWYEVALGQQKNQQDNKPGLLPAVPDDAFKMQTQIQKPSNVNLCFHGKQNIKVFVNCIGDSNINFSFKDNSAVQDVSQPSAESAPLKSTVRDQKTNQIHPKYVSRNEIKLKEKLHKSSYSAKNETVTKRRKH